MWPCNNGSTCSSDAVRRRSIGQAFQNASLEMASPLDRVIKARRTPSRIDVMMKRTEPSANAALKPPGCAEPAPRRPSLQAGLAGSNARSSGLVQGTESFASTTMSAFDLPSVTSEILTDRPSQFDRCGLDDESPGA
jgi:hypothetical protein